MKLSEPQEADPETPTLSRRRLLQQIAGVAVAAIPAAALAQSGSGGSIRRMERVRGLAGATEVIIEIVGKAPFHVGAQAWVLAIGKSTFGDYTYGPKGELNILRYRVPAAQFSLLAQGDLARVHYGNLAAPGRELGRFDRSKLR